uniref:Uncharacterized protein n=1 Tax=Arundo donax TaxID=35708 RepID=A0A0A8XZM3_ARUDO
MSSSKTTLQERPSLVYSCPSSTWSAYFTGSLLEPTVSNKSSLLPSATSISFTFSSCRRRSNLSGAYVDGIIEGTYLWMKAKIAA